MNKTALTLALIASLGITGCSSTPKIFSDKDSKPTGTVTQPEENRTAVKDTKIATNFTDEGVRLIFSMSGELERLEVIGVAPSWKGNPGILAEADAMDKLVKFVHGRSVTTDRRVTVMSKAIDRARDNTLNRFKSQGDVQEFEAKELESDATVPAVTTGDQKSQDNTSRRIADRVDETVVRTVTTITAAGRLTGVRKIRDEVKDDGRTYVAVYQWSDKDQVTADFIRNRMK